MPAQHDFRAFLRAAVAAEAEAESQADHRSLLLWRRCSADAAASAHNAVWRRKVSEWCYQVVDHVGESREVVFHAMSILDRYLASDCGSSSDDEDKGQDNSDVVRCRNDRSAYQAAAMTALLLASHQLKPASSPPRFGVRDLVRAGRGIVSVQDIKNAASKMLARVSLQARPAPASLIYPMIMPLASSGVAKNELHSLLDCATFLTELSVCDSYFVTVPSAVTAFAAVKCAVEACPSVSSEAKRALYDFIEESTELNVHSPEVQAAELRLGSFCLAEGEDLDEVHAAVVEAEVANSPRGVDVVPCDESEIKPLPSPSETEGHQQQRMKRMVSEEDIVVRPKRPSNDDGTATMTRVKRIRHFVVIED